LRGAAALAALQLVAVRLAVQRRRRQQAAATAAAAVDVWVGRWVVPAATALKVWRLARFGR
jgi:hypothetical protein